MRKILRNSVVISVVSVMLLTSIAAAVSFFIASGQEKEPENDLYITNAMILVTDVPDSVTYSSAPEKEENKMHDSELVDDFVIVLENDPEIESYRNGVELSFRRVDDSDCITISAVSENPKTAANAANLAAKKASEVFEKHFGYSGSGVSVVKEAFEPVNPGVASESADQVDVLFVVFITSLITLCAGALLAVIISAAVYFSYKKKYAANS